MVESQFNFLLFETHTETLCGQHGNHNNECVCKVESEAEWKATEPETDCYDMIEEDGHCEVKALVCFLYYEGLCCYDERNIQYMDK